MRKPVKKPAAPARQIGKSPDLAAPFGKQAKPVSPGSPPVSLSAEDKRQIKASRAIDTLMSRADAYTAAVLRETEYSIKRGIAKDSHVAKTQDARAKMLDAVGKLRLIVCPQAAALKS